MDTKYLKRVQGTLAYGDYGGGGAPVLMLPGLGALRSEFRYLGPRLVASGYRAFAVDLRGHGESSVPWPVYDIPSIGGDIVGMLEYLGAGPACVVGASFSAGAAV